MTAEGREGTGTAVATAAAIAVLVIVVVLVFVVLRDMPQDYICGDDEPPGQGAALDNYRSGAIVIHLAGAIVLGTALVRLSRERAAVAGRGDEVGTPTAVVLGLLALVSGISVFEHDTFLVIGLPALLLAALATPGGAAAIALVLCGLVYALGERGPRAARRTAATAGWLVLLVGLPASITAIYYQGIGPIFC